jgi:hypothetical protein
MAEVRGITDHPLNARHHTFRQQEVLGGAMRSVGVLEEVIISERSGLLLNGHLRVRIAREERQPEIPAIWVDVSEEEEALILSTFDALGAMSTISGQILEKTLERVKAGRGATVDGFLERLRVDAGLSSDSILVPGGKSGELDRSLVNPPTVRFGRNQFILGEHEKERLDGMMAAYQEGAGSLEGFAAYLAGPALAWLDEDEAEDEDA